MRAQTLKLVCFSPTGTTRAIIQSIARGFRECEVELVDITRPYSRLRPLRTSEGDLLVVAVPVYMGRVPALLNEWLYTIEARGTPAVCVVVYGNRAYENALLELKNILKERGCIPIAGAAYIGEHSFSSPEMPTAHGRPDARDRGHAEIFGRRIQERLTSLSSIDDCPDIDVPGEYTYGGVTELWSVDFIAVNDECTQCGICAEGCPVGAIDPEQSHVIDKGKCITCCACVKNCPEGARKMKAGPVRDAALRLSDLCGDRKEPVFFL